MPVALTRFEFAPMTVPINARSYEELDDFLFDPAAVKRCIAINFCGRAGSLLLHSLFDGHPQILTTPPDSILQGAIEIFPKAVKAIGKLGTVTPARAARAIFDLFRKQATSDEAFSAEFEERFVACLSRLVSKYSGGAIDWPFFLRASFMAYAFAQRQALSRENLVLVIQQHSDRRHTPNLLQTFEKTYFLVAVRSPAKGIDSLIRHFAFEKTWRGDPSEVTYHIMIAKYRFDLQSFVFSDQVDLLTEQAVYVSAVRFEDMHFATERLMKGICDVLKIKWDPVLIQSTANGQPYMFPKKAANGQVEYITGVGHRTANDTTYWGFNRFDDWRIEAVYTKLYQSWEYPRRALLRSGVARDLIMGFFLWIPFKSETIGWRESWKKAAPATWRQRVTLLKFWWAKYRQLRLGLKQIRSDLGDGTVAPVRLENI